MSETPTTGWDAQPVLDFVIYETTYQPMLQPPPLYWVKYGTTQNYAPTDWGRMVRTWSEPAVRNLQLTLQF